MQSVQAGGKRRHEGSALLGEAPAESGIGSPGGSGSSDEPLRVLGDAGMVLRDPSTVHLIIHQACSPPFICCKAVAVILFRPVLGVPLPGQQCVACSMHVN